MPDVKKREEQNQPPTATPADPKALGEIQSKVDAILDRLRQRDNAAPAPAVNLTNVLAKLDTLRTEMKSTAQASGARSPTPPADLDKLNELHTKLDGLASLCQTLHDRGPVQPVGGGELELPEVQGAALPSTASTDVCVGCRNTGSAAKCSRAVVNTHGAADG